MKVAIVHYWLVKMRGGEHVLQALCELFPEADIFTHVHCPEKISDTINRHKITTTFIQKLPFSSRFYRYYLPFMPLALKRLDLSGYDLIISSESGPAKGVNKGPGARHICYCHTPMRYIWDMYEEYRDNAGFVTRMLMPLLVGWLRKWDRQTAEGVDQFIANSRFVSQRIYDIYGRTSQVIYPPVAVDEFTASDEVGEYYLYAGEFVSYKQPQLAVEAFNESGRKLVVVGEGPLRAELMGQAKPNIRFLGRQSFDQLKACFSHCKALVFPGIEDFGIIPVEVMASGRPVIAYRGGGALETVVENRSGLFFDEQTPAALNRAIDQFEKSGNIRPPAEIQKIARKFSKKRFLSEMAEFIGSLD